MYDELVQKLRSVKDDWQTEEEQCMLDAADAVETLCGMVAIAYQENANIIATYEKDKPRWISVRERLPLEMEDKTPLSRWSIIIRPSDDVLIWLKIEKRQTVAWYSYEQECWTSVDEKTEYLPREVSHWMPLPEPPEEGGNADGN